ncbi:MAG TPA: nucleotide exchange factor GrpE [Rectinemataceae bacterium]|nr:nucleotide exchange factor GrpE [Rectinemataceae bacterium]
MSSKHHEPHDQHRKEERPQDQDAATPGTEDLAAPSRGAECLSEDEAVAVEGRALSAEARLELLQSELLAAKTELSAVNDKYLRKLADDVNFRKRMAREKEDSQRFAVASLLGDLIPVLDDFDRAVMSAETARDYTILHDGIVLIRRQLGQLLENKYGLKRLEALGKAFDPNHHEAVAMELVDEVSEPIVAEEFLPGSGVHDRVIRTAKVKVKMPGRPASQMEQQGSPDGSPDAGPAAQQDPSDEPRGEMRGGARDDQADAADGAAGTV